MDSTLVYMESQRCPDYMEALDPCSSGIDHKHITLCVTHHLQDMRMTAHEYIRVIAVYQFTGTHIITSGIAAHMSHEHLYSFTFEESVKRMVIAERLVVTVAGYAYKRLEGGHAGRQIHASAEVSGVPDLVNRPEELLELRVEDSMRI